MVEKSLTHVLQDGNVSSRPYLTLHIVIIFCISKMIEVLINLLILWRNKVLSERASRLLHGLVYLILLYVITILNT
jgi:hypothetical protein